MPDLIPFDAEARERSADGERLMLDIDGYEGPIDVLLDLARQQKVDLTKLSILELVEQYLAFIAAVGRLRLELAADYLVMAAWLTYLKSRLLLPPEEDEEQPTAEELALRLQERLRRLDAMRDAAARLFARDRLGRDVFMRGAPEGLRVIKSERYDCSLNELLRAYAGIQLRPEVRAYAVERRPVLSLDVALERLERLIGTAVDWTELSKFLPESADPAYRRSALASTFLAALELARLDRVRLDQSEAFGPLRLRIAAKGGNGE